MFKLIKKVFKYTMCLCVGILFYILLSITLSYITVNENFESKNDTETIYLHSNGVHLSIILPSEVLSETLQKDLIKINLQKFTKFGWGDENFYLNVPTWSDFKIKYAFGAFFRNNSTVLHVTSEFAIQKNWIPIKVNNLKLQKINTFLATTFKKDVSGNSILIPQNIYGRNNYFYKAEGRYSPIKTCNTWVNDCFKKSGLKASYWTLFDFGLLNKYK